MNAGRPILAVLGALALCLASLAVGYGVRYVAPGLGTPAVCAQEDEAVVRATVATAQMAKVKDTVQGRVLIGDRVVITTIFTNNEMDPYERASIAAARINIALEGGAGAEDFKAVQEGDVWYVVAGDRVIISVAAMEAEALDVSAESLATSWASGITAALHQVLGTEPPAEPIGPPTVGHREDVQDGQSVGVLLIDDKDVLIVRTASGGYAPPVRARMLATRLARQVEAGLQPSEVVAGSLYGLQVVQAREQLLISIERAEADKHGKSTGDLARDWARAISGALAAHYAPAEAGEQIAGPAGGTEAGTETADADKVEYSDKWVPIVSILEGTKLGMARIAGPSDKVALVQAVAQLETHWQKFIELDLYVPISTKVPGTTIDRVQGVGVTGLGDFQL